MFTMRFDMRAPSFGAPAAALYSAAADMCAWAEGHGCIAAVLCEHHGSTDGYLPSPLVSRVGDRGAHPAATAEPHGDPAVLRSGRLAEDICLLDIISGGRVSVTSSESVIGQRNTNISA